MSKYKFIALFGLLGFAVACERPTPPASGNAAGAAYNLAAYLQAQAKRLQAEKPTVIKRAKTEDKAAETIKTSEVDWEDELAIFQDVDISKPSLREYYTEEKQPFGNNLTAYTYTKTAEAEAPVQHLTLQTNREQKLQGMEAVLLEENMLFYSKRKVTLSTNPATGNITGYQINGVQKLVFGDSLHYNVTAIIQEH
ncbi:hypothetical protein [Pontibacter vulgaris]|uniref:hypothetical protein n=1 Tax=Pontibacter vulgaris TaxID=2905679 RepID=UPI001FA81100|nr:hypothetical protein [Pontibacter vulgaris]